MKTPFRLRKSTPTPANALMLPGADAGALLRLCARLGGASLPVIHPLASGFLIRLPRPDENAYPGVIRLRALSDNLLVPVDAELTPALLEDETTALVRQRGLIFMLGGMVLEFSPTATLSAGDVLAVPRLPDRAWKPLPDRPRRPDELSEILLDIPDPPPEAIIEAGAGEIAEEAAEPSSTGPASASPVREVTGSASPVREVTGSAAANLGAGLMWLGETLGWRGLAGMGAQLMARAIQAVPRITERLLGKQEAALRELLRQFREGKTDEALKRALPFLEAGDRGGAPAQDAELPCHSISYRLDDLLSSESGRGGFWIGTNRLWDELGAAYRAAAEEAVRRGDHRRAAFIYGKLLRDWGSAAAVLWRGGLYHDAAILYLEKVGHSLSAARGFAKAGEIDRAESSSASSANTKRRGICCLMRENMRRQRKSTSSRQKRPWQQVTSWRRRNWHNEPIGRILCIAILKMAGLAGREAMLLSAFFV